MMHVLNCTCIKQKTNFIAFLYCYEDLIRSNLFMPITNTYGSYFYAVVVSTTHRSASATCTSKLCVSS